MNKKLINGLLLLAVATSGASVFTSCKDNEDATLADVYNNQKRLADRLQEKDADLAARLAKLEDAGYLTQADRTYLLGLIEKNSNSIEAVKTYLDAKIASLVTSIEVQRVYNNMFGTLNLPFGINSTVLANYYYQSSNSVSFPNFDNPAKDEYNGLNPDLIDGVRAWELGIKPEAISMPANKPVFDDPEAEEGSLGKIYVTVNPSNIPAEGLPVTLVTSSKDEKKAVTTTLELKEADDIEFTFGGGTRGTSSNGLYVIDVPFKAEDIENIKVSLDEGLKQAVKDFYHDQNKTNLAAIAKGVYDQIVDTNLPAYALKLGYVNNPQSLAEVLIQFPGAKVDADGNIVVTNGQTEYDDQTVIGNINELTSQDTEDADLLYNYIYSKYEIAVATVHPLSFGTGEGLSIDRQLPSFGRIKDAINKYFDELKGKVKIEIKPSEGKSWNIEFDESKFTVNIDNIEIDLTGAPVYDENGDKIGTVGYKGDPNKEVKIILDKDGKTGEINGVYYASIKQLIEAIDAPVSEIKNVIDQVNEIMDDINKQLDGINGQIKDIISDIQDDFNNKLDGHKKLIDLYNDVVDRVNTFLKDPNHYLQVYAAYKENGGGLHHFSTDVNDPSLYKGDKGFKVYLTSYNGEILVPSYKKILTISNVYQNGKEVANATSLLQKANTGDLNKVLDGERHIVEVTGLEKGYTYELFYSALDYRGVTSSRKFYIEVK